MLNQFAFDVVAAFYCSTCDGVREVSTTVSAPVAEPLGFQLFALSSPERKCPICGSELSPEALHAIRPAGDVETWPSEFPWRWRSDTPRKPPRQMAKELLHGLTCGTADTYETYRSLYWLFIGSGVPELRPLFTIPGIEPDGQLSVTEDFKRQVLSSATAILANLQD
jgi:hypothetical protein